MNQAPGGLHLELAMNIAAPPEIVFGFFTDPSKFSRWLGPEAIIDPVPGGAFRVPYPGGQVAAGEVLEIHPLERILLTWGYEGEGQAIPVGATTIVVTFSKTAAGTLLTFRQHGFDAEAARDLHVPGWQHYLGQLDAAASEDAARESLSTAIASYLAGWGETDGAKRQDRLAESFDEHGEFRDRGIRLDGREALNTHIGNALAYMSGFTLRRSSEIDYCYGSFRYSWEIAGPDGTVAFSGQSFGELGLNGRIARIVGFWNG